MNGWLKEWEMVFEFLFCFKCVGVDGILIYFVKEVVEWLVEDSVKVV